MSMYFSDYTLETNVEGKTFKTEHCKRKIEDVTEGLER